MNKEQLLANVRTWIELDDQIKEYSKLLKGKRLDKKSITNILLDTMKTNEIDCFDLAGGNKLIYQKNKVKKTLSKKHLIESISRYLKDTGEAKELCEFILNSRGEELKENIRRKGSK
jgi:hypothetical protein